MATRSIAAALLALSFFVTRADALALPASVSLVVSNVTTFNSDLTPGPNADVYHITVDNPNAHDATSLSLSFSGNFVNNNPGGLTFSNTTDLPAIATFTFGETFFVLPPGQILSVNDVDTNSELSSEFTLAGSTALVPAGGSAVVAVISVPTGGHINTFGSSPGFFGYAAVNGVLECVGLLDGCPPVPEPSSAALCGLAIAIFTSKRRA